MYKNRVCQHECWWEYISFSWDTYIDKKPQFICKWWVLLFLWKCKQLNRCGPVPIDTKSKYSGKCMIILDEDRWGWDTNHQA